MDDPERLADPANGDHGAPPSKYAAEHGIASAAAAARLRELSLALDQQIHYDFGRVFPRLTGWGSKGEIRRKHKLIRQVEPTLKQMLHPGEQVLTVAKGVQNKLSEQYFLGWAVAAVINQTVFVLTNLRLLMINSNTKGKPKHSFWMIYYSQIENFKATWKGTVELRLRDRTKLVFTGFSKSDRKHMPAVFEQTLADYRELGFDPETTQSRENLCSFCFDVVPKNEYVCDNCHAVFWTPSALALRSLAIPAWGDLLMKHYYVAASEFTAYLMVLLWLVASVADSLQANAPSGDWLLAGFALVAYHAVDTLLTYFIAKKGLHPKRQPPLEALVEPA